MALAKKRTASNVSGTQVAIGVVSSTGATNKKAYSPSSRHDMAQMAVLVSASFRFPTLQTDTINTTLPMNALVAIST
jgi:hypothetical protein